MRPSGVCGCLLKRGRRQGGRWRLLGAALAVGCVVCGGCAGGGGQGVDGVLALAGNWRGDLGNIDNLTLSFDPTGQPTSLTLQVAGQGGQSTLTEVPVRARSFVLGLFTQTLLENAFSGSTDLRTPGARVVVDFGQVPLVVTHTSYQERNNGYRLVMTFSGAGLTQPLVITEDFIAGATLMTANLTSITIVDGTPTGLPLVGTLSRQ